MAKAAATASERTVLEVVENLQANFYRFSRWRMTPRNRLAVRHVVIGGDAPVGRVEG